MTKKDNLVVADFAELDIGSVTNKTVAHVLAYWNGLRGGKLAPAWPQWDWMTLPPEIIPYFGVVDVVVGPVDFVYRFWGSAHREATKKEMTGLSVLEMHPLAEARSVFSQYRRTFERGEPCLFENVLRLDNHALEAREVSLRLPLSDDGTTIDKLIAFSDFRCDAASAKRILSAKEAESD